VHRLLVAGAIWLAALVWSGTAGAWSWPADGAMLRPFTLGSNPYAAGQHRGIDVAGVEGSLVRAPASGVVTFAGSVPTNGRGVTILTADGYSVTLFHLGAIGVAKGDAVAEGAPVGTMGFSGDPEHPVPTAHLGIRVASQDDGYVDPLGLLPARPAPVAPAPPPAASATSPAPAPAASAAAPPPTTTAAPPPATPAASSPAAASPAAPAVPSTPAVVASPSPAPASTPPSVQAASSARSDAQQAGAGAQVSQSPTAGSDGVADGLVIVASPARPVDGPGRRTDAGTADDRRPPTAVRLVPSEPTRTVTAEARAAAAAGDAGSRGPARDIGERDEAPVGTRSAARRPVPTTASARDDAPRQIVLPRGEARDEAAITRGGPVAAKQPPVLRPVRPQSLAPLAGVVVAIAAIVLFATAVTRRAARRIAPDGAVLRHHADLLRQLDAAHRPRLHDGGRGRLCTPSAAARP
jgi:murein DD-endopeptidase MepM/ murein hydrolase activator NlpD